MNAEYHILNLGLGVQSTPLYLHRQCIPLEMVDLSNPPPPKFDNFSLFDCEGMCGN